MNGPSDRGDGAHRPRPLMVLTAAAATAVALWWLVYSLQVRLAGGLDLSLLALLVGVLLYPLLRRALGWDRRAVLWLYCFVLIAGSAYDAVSRFLPDYTAPIYFATPENRFADLAPDIPDWFVPKDAEIIRGFYEGSDDGTTPWPVWAPFVALWVGFFLLLWLTLLCLVLLLWGQWTERERLAFPLVQVPLLVAEARALPLGRRRLWRDGLFWLGAGVSGLHFLSIMLHAQNPALPTLGTRFDFGVFFTEHPLNALQRHFLLVHNPLLIGLAYFAPQDLCFSMFFFFFGIKAVMLLYRVGGWQEASGFPFFWEQSAGAFLAMSLFYAWAWRRHLQSVLGAAWRGTRLPGEEWSPRWPLVGALTGFAGLCLWYVAAGMSAWVAVLFFGMVVLFATIFTRARAESGVPSLASFPFWQASRQLKSWLGSGPLMGAGGTSNLTLLGSLVFLHFGLYPQTMTFQLESLKIAQEARMSRRTMLGLSLAAVLLGLIVIFHAFLTLYYRYGANVLAGGTTQGGYHVGLALQEYSEVAGVAQGRALEPDRARNAFTSAAFALTVVLVVVRVRFLRFPLHPLGYVLTASYGYAYWGPFLVAWLLKGALLRLGGVGLFRRSMPFFLGLVVGQVLMLSIVWQGFAVLWGEEWQRAADPLIYF